VRSKALPQVRGHEPRGANRRDRSLIHESIDERIANNTFFVDSKAHIVLDGSICKDCSAKVCVTACPAQLFVELYDGTVGFNYEHCLECGTCLILCSHDGALKWNYPRSGQGVNFSYG
jgi:ferredoxin like protein